MERIMVVTRDHAKLTPVSSRCKRQDSDADERSRRCGAAVTIA
jgi:hypothetical protein